MLISCIMWAYIVAAYITAHDVQVWCTKRSFSIIPHDDNGNTKMTVHLLLSETLVYSNQSHVGHNSVRKVVQVGARGRLTREHFVSRKGTSSQWRRYRGTRHFTETCRSTFSFVRIAVFSEKVGFYQYSLKLCLNNFHSNRLNILPKFPQKFQFASSSEKRHLLCYGYLFVMLWFWFVNVNKNFLLILFNFHWQYSFLVGYFNTRFSFY